MYGWMEFSESIITTIISYEKNIIIKKRLESKGRNLG